jgi:hypothetical protein
MPFERFNPSYPHISLGWVVCGIDQADKVHYHPVKDQEPCGYFEIFFANQWWRRPDTYMAMSPYDWKKIDQLTPFDHTYTLELTDEHPLR